MAKEVDRELSEKYCPRFGKIAADKGYVTPEQVKAALAEQVDDEIAKRPHRLIGRIFLDRGWMTAQEIEEVMNELFTIEKESR